MRIPLMPAQFALQGLFGRLIGTVQYVWLPGVFGGCCGLPLVVVQDQLVVHFQDNRVPHVVLNGAQGVICGAHLTSLINLLPPVSNVLCHNLGSFLLCFPVVFKNWCQIFSALPFQVSHVPHQQQR